MENGLFWVYTAMLVFVAVVGAVVFYLDRRKPQPKHG